MNNYQNNYQCNNCQKGFVKSEIYEAGKEKNLFCQECCRTVKNCSWCQKEVKGKEGFICWKQGTEHQQSDGSWMTTEIGEYNLFCSDNCRTTYKENTPEKLAERQQEQELLNKGYKRCGWNLIPFEPLKIDCNNLIPPSEKYCESCQKRGKKEKKI